MQPPRNERESNDAVLALLREGLPKGVRREIERRRQQGVPFYVARDGVVEVVMPDGTIRPVEPRP